MKKLIDHNIHQLLVHHFQLHFSYSFFDKQFQILTQNETEWYLSTQEQ